MRAEIVSIGTELLLGSITDTNATYLAQRLAGLGIDLFYVSQVGDNPGRIVETLKRAWERSDLVVTTGGLGPTQDDLTRESIAAMLGETSTVQPELESHLVSLYKRRGMPMPESNRKQATLIPSAQAIENPIGTAPGWYVTGVHAGTDRCLVAMPGVPFEMRRMWEREVEPKLGTSGQGVIVSRTLKTLGLGESWVAEIVTDLLDSPDPTLAPYAKNDGVHLRITTKAADHTVATARIARMEQEVRARLGDAIYGADSDTPSSVVSTLLSQVNERFIALEVGPGAIGALGPNLGSHPLCAGVISVTDLPALGSLVNRSLADESLADAMQSISSPDRHLVVGVETTIKPLEGADAHLFDSEAVLLYRGRVARSRQQWRTAMSEIPRYSALLALNLVRKELSAALAEKKGVGV